MRIVPLYVLIVHLASYGSLSRVGGDTFCSSFCVCDMWYKLRRASCTSRHLYSIQTGVSNTVEALDLSENSIATLLNYDLKNTGLVNLKYLNLSDNSINQIGSFAFAGLVHLTVLDLSRNHLYYVLWDTFVDSVNLRILHLDGNRFGTRIPDLHSTSISELGLSNCQISHVNTQAFAGLQQLRKLDLSNNFMIQIDFREFQSLPFLREINLDGNPWSCGSTKHLQSYLEGRKIKFNPPCVSANKKFEKMIDASSQRHGDSKEPEIDQRPENAWITDPPAVTTIKEICRNETPSKAGSTDELFAALATISPVWIFAVGFSLGLVTSMLGTYIWVTGTMCACKCPKIRRRDRARILDNNSQRISLLGPTCPGTPPPPYRDVMLHSSAYPSASSVISI